MFFACEMPQEKETFDIIPIIEDAIGLMRTTFRQKGITCEILPSKKSILLRIDKIQLTQVVFNLVVNAVYFSPPGSVITVTVLDEKERTVLKIADEGSGIPKENVHHIFDPFYTTKPIGEGSGLGLSVVHGIVQSHKGKIAFRPNQPTGTVFTIEFPKK